MNEHKEFSTLDTEIDDPSYRPVSGLSLLALVLSVPALGTIGFPYLVVFNVLAIFVAILAIRKMIREPRFVGMKVAQFALFLSMLSATLGIGYLLGHAWYLNGVAKKHSMTFGRYLLEGRYGEAYEFSLSPRFRKPEGTDLNVYYNNSISPAPGKLPPKGEIMAWMAMPPLSVMEQDNRQGKLIFQGFDDYKVSDHTWTPIACVYRYEPANRELEASTFQMVMMRRDFEKEFGTTWRFLKFNILAGPKPEEGMVRIGGSGKEDGK